MRKFAAILAVFLVALEARADDTPMAATPAPAGYSALSNKTWGEDQFNVPRDEKRKRAEQLYRELMESPVVKPEAPAAAATADESISK